MLQIDQQAKFDWNCGDSREAATALPGIAARTLGCLGGYNEGSFEPRDGPGLGSGGFADTCGHLADNVRSATA